MSEIQALFEERYQKSQEIDDNFSELYNTFGISPAIQYIKENGATWLDMHSFNTLYVINEWTKKTTKESTMRDLFASLALEPDVLTCEIRNSKFWKTAELYLKKKEATIKAVPFSQAFKDTVSLFPDIETEKREGTCGEKSLDISRFLDIPNEVVTGYCYGYTDQAIYLHSWVEIELNQKDYVIDGTLNAIINKDGYYYLRHVEPISRISSAVIESDIHTYLFQLGQIVPQVYFVYRDEIVKDFKKNDFIFQKRKVK